MIQDATSTRATLLAVVAVAVIAAIAFMPMADADDGEEPEYDKDLGVIWSLGYQFEFRGSGAIAIQWDFGDGSDVLYNDATDGADVNIWNPAHYFPEPGVYYITLTTYNTYDPDGDGTGSSTTSVYKLDVRGNPYVTLVYNNGQENGTIQQPSGESNAVAAERPADPTRDGYTFTGWYTDEGLTQAYDWSTPVTEPITLYAGWDGDGDSVPDDRDEGDGDGIDWLAIALIIIGIILVIAAFLFWPIAIIGIIVIVVGALKFMGVF